jgi:hypothetical protein
MPIISAPPFSNNPLLQPFQPSGIRDRLEQNGSALSYSDGSTPPFNKLAGNGNNNRNYSLHYNPNKSGLSKKGYSVTGDNFSNINSYFQDYLDGKNTPLPEPTQLDLDDPITADVKYKPLYTSINGGYLAVVSQLKQP